MDHNAACDELARDEKLPRVKENNRLRLFQAAPLGLGLVSRWTLLEVNDRLCGLTGYSRTELTGADPQQLFPCEADYRILCNAIDGVPRDTIPGGNTVRIRSKTGEVMEAILFTAPAGSMDGAVCLALADAGTGDRRESEKNRELFESILSNIQCITYRCAMDKDWTMMYMSPHVDQLTGYPPEQFVNNAVRTYESVIHRDDTAYVFQEIDKAISRGKPWDIEYRIVHRDGECRWVYEKGSCVSRKDGSVEYLYGFIINITARKAAEEKIRRLNETLEQQVARRTTALENRSRQLQQTAIELSDAEDRERRNIAAILHDDFQQQLAYIKMELAILQKNADGSSGQRLAYLENILGDCIEKSRNLSYEINPPALHRNGLLAALELLMEDMKLKYYLNVTARMQEGAEPKSLTLASILYRSVRELLINVVKHADVDTAFMDIHAEKQEIVIQVRDSGVGFDYDALQSTHYRRSGFGLYNIEDRIVFLGGRMVVNTAPGKGCHITLSVPREMERKQVVVPSPAERAVSESEAAVALAPGDAAVDGTQIRILLADDHQMLREALARLLQGQQGMHIVGQAVDGIEAVQLAAKLKPHVILMDVTMPKMDGFEASMKITQTHPDIHIIGLSMHNDADTRRKMYRAGAKAYLTKTGSLDVLMETIRRVQRADDAEGG